MRSSGWKRRWKASTTKPRAACGTPLSVIASKRHPMRLARSLAVLLLGCAACVCVLAQEPARDPRERPAPPPATPKMPERGTPEPDADDPEPAMTEEAREQRRTERRQRAGAVSRTFTVKWDAPEELRKLFEKHLPPPKAEEGGRRGSTLRPWIRDIRRRVPEIAASEGYFSAAVEVDFADEARSHIVVKVAPGTRTVVDKVDIEFTGHLAGPGAELEARRQALRESWTLRPGMPMRSSDWDVAKTR